MSHHVKYFVGQVIAWQSERALRSGRRDRMASIACRRDCRSTFRITAASCCGLRGVEKRRGLVAQTGRLTPAA